MKILTTLLVLSFAALISCQLDDEIFKDYILKFKIKVRRNANINNMKNQVVKNFNAVKQHNERFIQGLETFNQSLNEFSYFSNEEFARFNLGALEDDPNEVKNYLNETNEDDRKGRLAEPPADYFRWPSSVVGPVKSQGSCGSCYAFAAMNVIRSRLAIQYGISNYDLSEQDAMECSSRGCNGGWEYSVYRDYSQKYNGVAAYNYGKIHSYSAAAYGCQSRPRVPNTKVKSYGYVPNNEQQIRTYLYNYGPLYARYSVYENFYQYSSGIYSSSSGRYLGSHAVLLVGYGVENGVKYWIVKNSWDSWWGESGFFRILRGSNFLGIEGGVSAVTSL